MSKDLFRRYVWLVDVIYRNGKLTFKEINDKWVDNINLSYGEPIALRTFHNHKNQIQDIFDISIACDKQHYYYIEDREELANKGLRNWLLNTFSVSNLLNECYRYKDKILFEQVPSSGKYLTEIVQAIKEPHFLEVTYQSYNKEYESTFLIAPFCVKVFKQRWYVVGRNLHYGEIRTYALDRIKSLVTQKETFLYPKKEIFDPNSFFDNYFGVIADETIDISTIQLKVYGTQRNYLLALPLHATQKVLKEEQQYSVFEYRLSPTYDFYQELLSLGDTVEVLEPQNVREELKRKIAAMAHRYAE